MAGALLVLKAEKVEIINEGANLGFNGLINLLSEETYSSVNDGYFIPENQKQADLLLRELKVTENLNKIEYQCNCVINPSQATESMDISKKSCTFR